MGCPTLNSLIALGFGHRDSAHGETVGYRFRYLDLEATLHKGYSGLGAIFGDIQMPVYVRGDGVMLSGDLHHPQVIPEIGGLLWLIPADIGSASEAAAWISHTLKHWRSYLEPLPDWFIEGEHSWDLLPPAHPYHIEQAAQQSLEEQRRYWEAYDASPKCSIDRDYAMLLRRNLRKALAELAGEAEMTFRFDGRVLSVTLHGHVNEVVTPTIAESRARRRDAIVFGDYAQEVVASGDSWPSAYRLIVSSETTLPDRFPYPTVELSMFEGYAQLDRHHRLGLYEETA